MTDDEIEIEWIDQLPPRSEAVGALYRIASALRSNPGRWAKVPKVCNTVSTATTSANVMRKEYPLPDWEITTRGTMIYARYLG